MVTHEERDGRVNVLPRTTTKHGKWKALCKRLQSEEDFVKDGGLAYAYAKHQVISQLRHQDKLNDY